MCLFYQLILLGWGWGPWRHDTPLQDSWMFSSRLIRFPTNQRTHNMRVERRDWTLEDYMYV